MSYKKHEEKKIKALLACTLLVGKIIEIVTKEHPEITQKAIIQIVRENPELFDKRKE